MRRLLSSGLAAGLILAFAPLAQASSAPHVTTAAKAPSAGTAEGSYAAVAPARLYDSRTAIGRPLRSGEVVTVPVAGRSGVPSASNVEAVVVNLTVTGPTKRGDLAAFPSSSTGAGVSSLNFAAGDTRAALATVPVGADGAIKVRPTLLTGGTTSVVVDVQGYYASASATPATSTDDYFGIPPTRVVDTREPDSNGEVFGPLQPYDVVVVDIGLAEDDTTDPDDVDALAVNLTAVGPTAPGYLVAYDGAADTPPDTSNVNFKRGETTPNNVVVPVQNLQDDQGKFVRFGVGNGSQGTVNVVADVVGVYAHDSTGGLRFEPLDAPVRITDSRIKQGLAAPLGPRQTGTVTAPSTVATPGGDDTVGATRSLVGTVTAVKATAATFLTAWAADETQPEVSNLNPAAGQTVANHAVIGLSDTGAFNLYNQNGRTDVLVDVTGRFTVPTADASRSDGVAAQRRSVHRDDFRPGASTLSQGKGTWRP
ncbi:hypothetical protein GCM10011519_04310 [Marmoricola endophyticus]|uniref:Uncharacterized protein n=1 Tax=Marmoricola endophyticus TaxID=2040280 RepID=A0A917BAV2_9ACTN|nr:hypothetical protein [Marmoricola endophyticus]GGF33978.1 hypothetical protein GCM10011519_04310 [Marmoricola endophyticus]